jgi:hypothetical protein
LPGGELEGPRPRVLCASCRERGTPLPVLCFACYRAQLSRERAIGAVLERAAEPFDVEWVDVEGAVELEKAPPPVRGVVRQFHQAPGPADGDPRYARFAHRRRQAQIAARRALGEPAIDLEQFPVSWRPFVRIALHA